MRMSNVLVNELFEVSDSLIQIDDVENQINNMNLVLNEFLLNCADYYDNRTISNLVGVITYYSEHLVRTEKVISKIKSYGEEKNI